MECSQGGRGKCLAASRNEHMIAADSLTAAASWSGHGGLVSGERCWIGQFRCWSCINQMVNHFTLCGLVLP